VATVNRQITLVARPAGFPRVSDFDLVYATMPSPAAGELLVRSIYLSLDPHVRQRMNENGTYPRTIVLGEVIPGGAVGLVVASEDPGFVIGDVVEGLLGWQEYAVVPARALRKIDSALAPLSTALGVLGMPGLTAYFGLLDICEPRPGETVVVSGAAGGVGMIVGQIAKIRGCHVVGVAAPDAGISWLVDELGFDAAINYRTEAELHARLEEHCPDGVDVYFDNMGGVVTDAVVRRLRPGARISVCGQLSQDNLVAPETGPRWLSQLVVKQAKVQGFLVSSFAERFPEGLERLAGWFTQGRLGYREDVARGLEAAPQAFIGMLQGKNQGKQLVHLSDS